MSLGTVKSKYLLLIAGVVWSLAGIMVMKTGFPLIPLAKNLSLIIFGGLIVFLVFYLQIFSKLVYKHEYRIRMYDQERLPFWLFFDRKSYLFVIVMMGGGTLIRKLELVPHWFIAFFYSGLGVALFACGIRFIVRFFRYEGGFKVIYRLDKQLKHEKHEEL
ncbi:MAG: hypothetical protein GX325_07180 [Peptococcaceae bacterium]|nr:hypothetical protein [Peptococcaceae bacterium]